MTFRGMAEDSSNLVFRDHNWPTSPYSKPQRPLGCVVTRLRLRRSQWISLPGNCKPPGLQTSARRDFRIFVAGRDPVPLLVSLALMWTVVGFGSSNPLPDLQFATEHLIN